MKAPVCLRAVNSFLRRNYGQDTARNSKRYRQDRAGGVRPQAEHNWAWNSISTGGTARLLRDSGIPVKDISELTGFPEMLDGRVKTLHPKVHGGILHIRDNQQHRDAVAEHGILPIDMVVVNLYAFEKTASKPGVSFHELIENIDIGGPSMVRSAAKNFQDVAIVTSPADYDADRAGDAEQRRLALARDQVAAGAEGIRHHGGLRFGNRVNAGTDCGARRQARPEQ